MDELFKSGNEIPGDTDEILVSDEEARGVKELLQALVKTKHAFEMYPSNNPLLGKFQEELFKRLTSHLDENDSLRLVVHQYDLFYKGRSVYHNSEKEDNLALFFYRDGLRELTVSEGFTADELSDLLDVIRARPDSSTESYDDDVATLLWEKDFTHLSYFVADDFVDASELEDSDVQRLLDEHTTDGELSEAYRDAMAENEKEIFSPLENISMGFLGVFSLGEEEVKSLKEEMSALTDGDFLEGAISALFESLYLEKGTKDFDVLMDNLDSALNFLVSSGAFHNAALMLSKFHKLLSNKEMFTPAETERVRLSIAKAGSEARVQALAQVLNSGHDINIEDCRHFLGLLGKNSIIPLTNLVVEVQDIKYRKFLIDALVALGRDNIDVLAAGLKDRRWYMVRNVAAILGRIGDRTALENLSKTLTHPEPKVRREIVRSLGMVGGPDAGEILLHALEDEDQQIRMAALRYLPSAQSYSVIDHLVEMITRQDFSDRSMPEKRAFFEVLGEIGQEHVLSYLITTFRRKTLFGRSKNEEFRICAAFGLGNIHQNGAVEALQEGLKKAKKGSPLHEAITYSVQKLISASGHGTGVS